MSEQFKISEEMLDRLSNLKALINKHYGYKAEYLAVLKFAREYVTQNSIPTRAESVIEAYELKKAIFEILALKPIDVESKEVGGDALLYAPIFLSEKRSSNEGH